MLNKLRKLRSLLPAVLMIMVGISYAQALPNQNSPKSDSTGTVAMTVLPSGVRLKLKPESDSDMLAITAMVRLPAAKSKAEKVISEIVANSLFYASSTRSSEDINAELQKVGGSIEVVRTNSYIAITCYTSPGQFESAAHLLSEVLKNADFTSSGLNLARYKLQKTQNNGSEHLEDFIESISKQTDIEPEIDLNLLDRVTPAIAAQYYATVFTPIETTISVAGKFDPNTAYTVFREQLNNYNRPSRQSFTTFDGNSLNGLQGKTITSNRPGKVHRVMLAFAAPGAANPDYAAFTVLQIALGIGHGSRLISKIRDEFGLAYQVGVSYRPDQNSPLIAYIEWDASHSLIRDGTEFTQKDAIALLQKEIDRLSSEPLTSTELERASGLAIGLDLKRYERLRERAFMPAWFESTGVGYNFDSNFYSKLKSVTYADIMQCAKKYLSREAIFQF